MTIPVIVTIILGLILIAVSFSITEKDNDIKTPMLDQKFVDEQTEIVKEKVQKQVGELLDNKSEEYIEKTDDELSKVSNEKIMAFHEYSEQVFEKIDQNHNEVVFLYDMLSNKEQELKDTIREVNNTKKEIEEQKKTIEEQRKTIEETKQEIASAVSLSVNNAPNRNELSQIQHKAVDNFDIKEKDKTEIGKEKQTKASNKKKEEIRDKKTDEEVEAILDMEDYNEFVEQNNNEEILTMYESGKSVIEISKELGIGQGEVKLVINLYKGINRK